MRVCKAVGSVALSLVIVLSVLCVHGFKHLPRASKVTRTKQLSMVAELHEPLLTALTSAGHHHAALHDSMLVAVNKFTSAPPGAFGGANPFGSGDVSASVGTAVASVGEATTAAPAVPDPAAAVSIYSKVDKTGVIGGIAGNIIEPVIDFFHSSLNRIGVKYSYGFSIIAFTCIVKVLTLPLTNAQLESTTKMQKLTPLQQKINAKYSAPEDEQTKNQLLSQLFQAANVNPLAGCFPALVQIPVFLSLYRALQNLVAENKLDEPFLWIPDLEGPVYMKPPGESLDWVKSIFTGTPSLGWDDTLKFLTIPAILFVSQTISTKIMQPPKDPNRVMTDQELTSQGIINNIPFIVSFFSLNVPAGLGLYWIINNILTTLITQIVKANLKDEAMPVEVEKMMAAIEADTVGGGRGSGAAVKSRMSGAQAELGRGMGTRMSEEDRMRLEKFEQMQSKGGFGAGGGVTGGEGSSLPVVDVTPGPPSESVVESETTEIATAGGMEEPKGPIGKALKFVNENASKLEGQIEADNQSVMAQEQAMTQKINEKIGQNSGGSRRKKSKKSRGKK